MHVLVIENEQFFAENLCQYLRRITNINITYIPCVKDALKSVSETKFDLIISDLRLPDTTDDNWLLELGMINPGQKLIIISSYQIPEKLKLTDKLNIIEYFEKPFDIEEIVRLINQLKNEEVVIKKT